MPTVTIFCGYKEGLSEIFKEESTQIARMLAQKGYDLIYGGGECGLMGNVAQTFIQEGQKVTAIIPEYFIGNSQLNHTTNNGAEVVLAKGMGERKAKMMELADAFIILPGGMGTLDELADVLTHRYFGEIGLKGPAVHNKPIGMLNTNNYWGKVLEWIKEDSFQSGFTTDELNTFLISAHTPERLIQEMGL